MTQTKMPYFQYAGIVLKGGNLRMDKTNSLESRIQQQIDYILDNPLAQEDWEWNQVVDMLEGLLEDD